MSRTRRAFDAKPRTSSSGCPKSFTSSAPETLKRSLMVVFICALRLYDSRVMPARRRPTQRAGSRKTGSRISDSSVICQERKNIATNVMLTPMTLPTTEAKVSVKACWAPRTSLLRREISAPVWVRVKNEIGISLMCANTLVRMSKMSPSPTRADSQRCASPRMASKMASAATPPARTATRLTLCPRMPSSMMAR